RPEYNELKEEITRLGGTKKIRELLAAEEGTNRQAFIQNKRVVATTATRVVADPLFGRVRFDVLIADEAPFIPAPFLLAAAGLVRERIVLSGDMRDIPTARAWGAAWATPLGARHLVQPPSELA
ncbi:MAG: AAA domain-containing protein, partial [Nitrospirota bacterium]